MTFIGPSSYAVPVLYLDLDGTVRHGKDDLGRYVDTPDDVAVWPEAIAMMQSWKEAGGRICGVTNQGRVALGYLSYTNMAAALDETNAQTGDLFDYIFACIHHPNAKEPYMQRCWCRKPSGGAIAEAAHRMAAQHPDEYYPPHLALMVGDRFEDQKCAQEAGVSFRWAEEWRSNG
jgi:D-glycero-D-manno-heptose 1,7-bisphosphate phosphatase